MSRTVSNRLAAVSGLFYSDSPEELRREVERYTDEGHARPLANETPLGLVVPHAGYMYSGRIAGKAYSAIRNASFATVVVIAPSHKDAFNGVTIFGGESYTTPLGTVRIDSEMREKCCSDSEVIVSSHLGHRAEHAIEVQLPFLQALLGDFLLLPVVMGSHDREVSFMLGETLARVLRGTHTLIVASTDLSHFFPSDVAKHIDAVTIDDIRKFDPEQLSADLASGSAEACGGAPTVAALVALKALGATRVEITAHGSSADVTRDRRSVVGYCSAIVWGHRTP
jgi:AmmeMemoRadiSam system protein B